LTLRHERWEKTVSIFSIANSRTTIADVRSVLCSAQHRSLLQAYSECARHTNESVMVVQTRDVGKASQYTSLLALSAARPLNSRTVVTAGTGISAVTQK